MLIMAIVSEALGNLGHSAHQTNHISPTSKVNSVRLRQCLKSNTATRFRAILAKFYFFVFIGHS